MTLGLDIDRRGRLNVTWTRTDIETGAFVEDRTFLEKKKGESLRHVAMKLLAYLVWYDPALEIERDLGQHYKPDVVSVDLTGQPLIWMDCGQTSAKKLETIVKKNRETRFWFVKPTPGEMEKFARVVAKRVVDPARVEFVSFTNNLAMWTAERLHSRHNVVLSLAGNQLWVELDGEMIESEIVRYAFG